jgi:1-phosphofructokinase family hexose kinase
VILCLGPNPAIDRTFIIPRLKTGVIYRPEHKIIVGGGKGINVARAVRRLGGESLCAGFVGGHEGRFMAQLVEEEGLPSRWTWIDGQTRTCTIVADPETGQATVFNELGPSVTAEDWNRLQADMLAVSPELDFMCISGSVPQGTPPESYQALIRALAETGKPVWVDTSGKSLRAAMGLQRIGIKVNGEEAGEILGREINDVESAAKAASEISRKTGSPVVLTLGAEGGVMADGTGCWHAKPPPIRPINAVASGDSFLAGLAVALSQGKPAGEALRWAVAAGTANALNVGGAQIRLEDFEKMAAGTVLRAL